MMGLIILNGFLIGLVVVLLVVVKLQHGRICYWRGYARGKSTVIQCYANIMTRHGILHEAVKELTAVALGIKNADNQ